MIINDRPVRWWDGTRWLPVDEQKVVDHSEEIRVLHEDIRSELNGLHVTVMDRNANIDSDMLRRLVKESMDEWLTKAASDTQAFTSTKDQDASEHHEEVPENAEIPPMMTEDRIVLVKDPAPAIEQSRSQVNNTGDNGTGKPSWL